MKLTNKLKEKIIRTIKLGASYRIACFLFDIPPDVSQRWLEVNTEFKGEVIRASWEVEVGEGDVFVQRPLRF